ncbi:hypothetical protein BC835DRAFT_1421764 [Cytidiella melzeri]|nr:hypothetical protein BC835DRAFT_1421764 [Cytidiella melzeri]
MDDASKEVQPGQPADEESEGLNRPRDAWIFGHVYIGSHRKTIFRDFAGQSTADNAFINLCRKLADCLRDLMSRTTAAGGVPLPRPLPIIRGSDTIINCSHMQFLSKTTETLQSKAYQAHVQDQVLVVMISPNIPAYLKNAVDIVMNFIKESPEWFKLNRATLHSMEKWRIIRTIDFQIAASLISSTDKLRARTGTQDIIAMVNEIALEYINTNCSHHTRFAFLRQCYLKHCQVQVNAAKGTSAANSRAKKNNSLWKYVNNELQKATVQTKAKLTSDAQAAALLKEYFDFCLKADLRLFTIRNGALPSGPAYLLPIQHAINNYMGAVVV